MTKCGHVALAGLPNVGKSSLMNTLVGEPLAMVSPKAQATRVPVVGLRTDTDIQYVFHDLPGLLEPRYLLHARMRALALETLAKCDVLLHLHPGPDAPAPSLMEMAKLAHPPAVPVLTVYTKADLVPAEKRAAEGLWVSSETEEGIPELLAAVAARLPEGPFQFEADDLGTQPMRFFVVEYLREAAFEMLEDELPYVFQAEVEEFREERTPVYIRTTLFVETPSQKGILIGDKGKTLKAIGVKARARLEHLLGRAVYLETWVKVLPKWRKNGDALARFGFPRSPEEPS
ncbi:MAG: GTPase Era [Gemmatimonadetes bacterium]|nr:GTPase Era [Gemmatimonadota bacterium]